MQSISLNSKNLYMFYIMYILPGLVDVLGIYLRYDNIGDILLQNVAILVYLTKDIPDVVISMSYRWDMTSGVWI